MTESVHSAYIGGIQKFSINDGPGIRTTVFLKGCPLNCAWCHNPELISFREELMRSESRCIGCGLCIPACPQGALSIDGEGYHIDRSRCDRCLACVKACPGHALRPVAEPKTVAEIMAEVVKDKPFYAQSGGGVTISGGELLSQADFAAALLAACRSEGISVALDTSGFGDGEALYRLAQAGDYVLFDIKSGLPEAHQRLTGVSLTPIRENLRRLAADPATRAKVILRMPLISGVNDTEEDIAATCAFLDGLGFSRATLLPYHELGISKSAGLGLTPQRFTAPDSTRLHAIRDELAKLGIHAEIGGEDA